MASFSSVVDRGIALGCAAADYAEGSESLRVEPVSTNLPGVASRLSSYLNGVTGWRCFLILIDKDGRRAAHEGGWVAGDGISGRGFVQVDHVRVYVPGELAHERRFANGSRPL